MCSLLCFPMQTAVFWDAAQQHILIPAPNVTTYCFYSYGLPSAASLSYSTADFSDTPQVGWGRGPGGSCGLPLMPLVLRMLYYGLSCDTP